MKKLFYFITLLLIISVSEDVTAQKNVSYTTLDFPLDNFVFTRIIDGTTYHFSLKTENGERSGSELIIQDGEEVSSLIHVREIGDTLLCHNLMDIWEEEGTTYMLAYTHSNTRNYISLLEYNKNRNDITLIDNQKIGRYKQALTNSFKDLIIDGYKEYIITEHSPYYDITEGFMRLKVGKGSITSDRLKLEDTSVNGTLVDQYYDDQLELYLLTSRKNELFMLDKNFNLILRKKNKRQRGQVIHEKLKSFVLGSSNENLVSYEYISTEPSVAVLSKRLLNTHNSQLQISTNYEDIVSTGTSDWFKKVFKEDRNYMIFSRPFINDDVQNYGYNLLTFDKEGNLLRNDVFYTGDLPVIIQDFDIDEDNKRLAGVGRVYKSSELFSFYTTINTVVTNQDVSRDIPILRSNKVTSSLQLIENRPSVQYIITNSSGSLFNLYPSHSQIDVSDLPNGMYIITMIDGHKTNSERFLKY